MYSLKGAQWCSLASTSVWVFKKIIRSLYITYPDGHRGGSKRKLPRNGNHQKSARRHVGRYVHRRSWLTSLIITEEFNTPTTTSTSAKSFGSACHRLLIKKMSRIHHKITRWEEGFLRKWILRVKFCGHRVPTQRISGITPTVHTSEEVSIS